MRFDVERYSIVEGPVTEFVPDPASGKGMERFSP